MIISEIPYTEEYIETSCSLPKSDAIQLGALTCYNINIQVEVEKSDKHSKGMTTLTLREVPKFLVDAFNIVRSNIEKEGLFRKAGNNARINSFSKKLTAIYSGRKKIPAELNYLDVCSLIKYFLKALKIPLLYSYDLSDKLLELAKRRQAGKLISGDDVQRLFRPRGMLHKELLPEAHIGTLGFLMRELYRISLYSEKNGMTIQNLATCFGPTLFDITPRLDRENLAPKKSAGPLRVSSLSTIDEAKLTSQRAATAVAILIERATWIGLHRECYVSSQVRSASAAPLNRTPLSQMQTTAIKRVSMRPTQNDQGLVRQPSENIAPAGPNDCKFSNAVKHCARRSLDFLAQMSPKLPGRRNIRTFLRPQKSSDTLTSEEGCLSVEQISTSEEALDDFGREPARLHFAPPQQRSLNTSPMPERHEEIPQERAIEAPDVDAKSLNPEPARNEEPVRMSRRRSRTTIETPMNSVPNSPHFTLKNFLLPPPPDVPVTDVTDLPPLQTPQFTWKGVTSKVIKERPHICPPERSLSRQRSADDFELSDCYRNAIVSASSASELDVGGGFELRPSVAFISQNRRGLVRDRVCQFGGGNLSTVSSGRPSTLSNVSQQSGNGQQNKPSTTFGLTAIAPVFSQPTTPPSKVQKTSGKEVKKRLRASSAEGKKNRSGKKTNHKSQPPKPPKQSPLPAARKRKSVEKKPEIDQKPAKIEQKDYASLPPGMKPSDFKRPEGAGTDFVLDLGPPNKLKSPAPPPKELRINPSEPHRVRALEVEGGKNFATLPEGTKPTDFAQPTEAGTGFVFDMTPSEKKIENKAEKRPSTTHLQQKDRSTTPLRTATASTSQEQKPHTSGNVPKKMNALEVEGGKNMTSLPQGSKPEDFAQPTEAGTGFVLDLTPAPVKQEMALTTAYHAVIPKPIVAAPPMSQMLADPEKEKDKKDEPPTAPQKKTTPEQTFPHNSSGFNGIVSIKSST
ncbi:unnamed protein product, partial [Mesorhabditis belari]|uniref:Rho-GAP domain-containing protein n=1 Tax=Mesorhabditis belari TaxID=2138241 RepID=A0AAF3ESP6_9BILA